MNTRYRNSQGKFAQKTINDLWVDLDYIWKIITVVSAIMLATALFRAPIAQVFHLHEMPAQNSPACDVICWGGK